MQYTLGVSKCTRTYACLLLAETRGERGPLEQVVTEREHYKPLIGRWRYTVADPWPPVSCELTTPFWSAPKYQHIRDLLRVPLPAPSVSTGSEFITVDLVGQSVVAGQAGAAPVPEPAAAAEPQGGFQFGDEPGDRIPEAEAPRPPPPPPAEVGGDVPPNTSMMLHVVPFKSETAFPSRLAELKYKAVFYEVEPLEIPVVHPHLRYLLGIGVPIFVYARRANQVDTVINVLRDDSAVVDLKVYRTIVARPPEPEDAPMTASLWELRIVSTKALRFRIPSIVTCGSAAYMHLLAPEIVGHFLRQLGVASGQFVLIVSADCKLATMLLLRDPTGFNATWGLPRVAQGADTIKLLRSGVIEEVLGLTRQVSSLPPIPWDHVSLSTQVQIHAYVRVDLHNRLYSGE